MLSLQSQLSSPGEEVSNEDDVNGEAAGLRTNEDASRRVDDGTSKRIDFNAEDADMDVESSSDSGWSVRDNPIASDESATEESSGEEINTEIHETFARPRKVQSVAGVASGKNTVSPPLQLVKLLGRGNSSDHSNSPEKPRVTIEDPAPPGTPAGSAGLACSSCTESQRRSAMKAQEWDLGLDVNGDDEEITGARRSMMSEQVETLSDFSHGSSIAYTNNSIDESVSVNEGWCTTLVRSAKSSCSRITSIAEAVLGGSLCVVIAVPVTMLLARVLQSPQDHFLVPT